MKNIIKTVTIQAGPFLALILVLPFLKLASEAILLPANFHLYLWQFVASLAWILGGGLAWRLINLLLAHYSSQRLQRKIAPALLRSIAFVSVSLTVIAGVMAQVFHQDITALWAMSGGVGLILGFALQGLIGDFFSGITINAEGSIKVGDYIILNNIRLAPEPLNGKVIDISWHATKIRTQENSLLVIPNHLLNTTVITNLSSPSPETAFELSVVFSPRESPARLERVLAAAALATTDVLHIPQPRILAGNFSGDGQEIIIKAWYTQGKTQIQDVKSDLMNAVKQHLYLAGISPFNPLWKIEDQNDELSQRGQVMDKVGLFAGLEETERIFIAANLQKQRFSKGDWVFREGDNGESLYIILEGVVAVSTNKQGETVELARLEPGSFFGEMSLFAGEPRSADISCITEVILFEVNFDLMENLLKSSPKAIKSLGLAWAERQASNLELLGKPSVPIEELEQEAYKNLKKHFSGYNEGGRLIGEGPGFMPVDSSSPIALLIPQIGARDPYYLAKASVILGAGLPRPNHFTQKNMTPGTEHE
ncbi:MAG: mechanosensitive ion channel family protein [SAR324 cluster bacterium]|nr:mechanosensitive ion channel family protein [SAR324 cluster bacterium]